MIFVTAETEADVEAYGFEIGAVDFIAKPINPAVVQARAITHLTLKLYMDNMRNIARLDGLTSLLNRRRFDELLTKNWLLCRREQRPIALLMMDGRFFPNAITIITGIWPGMTVCEPLRPHSKPRFIARLIWHFAMEVRSLHACCRSRMKAARSSAQTPYWTR